jgi:hypothetical protein
MSHRNSYNRSLLSAVTFFCIQFLCSSHALASGSVRGFVTDSTSGEAIIYANVAIKGTTLGTTTNTKGYYFIPALPPGTHTLSISILGYRTKHIVFTVAENETRQCNVRIVQSSVQLQEMTVVGEKEVRLNETNLGLQTMTAKDLAIIPQGIEADIFRAIQFSTGVSSTGDVTSRYYVRGGTSDQNLVLLDGVTIYNPFHALGILSAIDPEVISAMEFHKGGFPAEFGGRLSSVMNIVTKDGNTNSYHGTANASFVSAKASFEGPIPNGSFLVTGRKSYYSGIFKNFLNGQNSPFDFWDVTYKAHYADPEFESLGKFTVHGFLSGDEVNNHDPLQEDYSVHNAISGLSWQKVWASPLYSTVSISYSGSEAETRPNLTSSHPRSNHVDDITGDIDFTYVYESRDEIAFGVENKYLRTNLQVVNPYGSKISFNSRGFDMNGYVDYQYKRWDQFRLNLGVRTKLSGLSVGRPFLLEPRISSTYRPHPQIALKASIGWYSQEITSLSNEREVISIFEPWVITPNYLNSPQAANYMGGVEFDFNEHMSLELETYYKAMTNMVDINDKKYSDRDNDFINVRGHAYGLEALYKYQPSSFFFQASYSLSWAFKEKYGVLYAPRYDARHTLSTLASYDFGSGWQLSANWMFRTGLPFTPIGGFYDRTSIDPYAPTTSEPIAYWDNSLTARLPDYHRLDCSFSKIFKISTGDLTFGGSILNVYNKKNIFYFNRDSGKSVYMLPFTPSLFIKAEL